MRKLTDLMSSDLPSIAEWIGISCALFHNNGLQLYCYCRTIVNYTRGFLLSTLW